MPMNPEIKTEWVAALRSGQYIQGRDYLHWRNQNLWCCLGVLCDIAEKHGVVASKPSPNTLVTRFYDPANDDEGNGDHSTGELPLAVARWAGFTKEASGDGDLPITTNPCVTYVDEDGNEQRDSLAEINDSRYAFDYIAALIEDQL